MKNIEMDLKLRDSTRVRELCAQVLAFFQEQRSLRPQDRRGYCQTLEDGSLQTKRTLGCGIVLILASYLPKTASLRIGLEPTNFKNWIKSLGDIELFYTDPFGIEIMLRDGLWGAYIGPHRLPFDLTRREYHEIGHLEIQNGGAYFVTSKASNPVSTESAAECLPDSLSPDLLNSRVLPEGCGVSRSISAGVADPASDQADSSSAARLLRILEGAD